MGYWKGWVLGRILTKKLVENVTKIQTKSESMV